MRTVTLTRAQIRFGPLALINRDHPIPAGPTPELCPVNSRYPDILLHPDAVRAVQDCIRAVDAAENIVPVSGWRSQAGQQAIWDDTLRTQGERFTRQYVARPGCSEHQTGLAIDLGQADAHIDFIRPRFPNSGPCGAFRRAAARYGLIQRYQKEKSNGMKSSR